jgi:hypothetical protein
MADLTALADIDQTWGGDIGLSPTGDLGRVTRAARSKQRVLRRLMTNPGDYIWHPTYGAGLPGKLGSTATASEIQALILAQMKLEPSVAQSPAPVITVTVFPGGLAVRGVYTALPDRQPVPLSFEVTP